MMTRLAMPSQTAQEHIITRGLRQLSEQPPWLLAALDPEQVRRSLIRHIPAFAAGNLRLVDCDTSRLFLKDTSGRWRGSYALTVEGPPGEPRRDITVRVILTAPGIPMSDGAAPHAHAFESDGWAVDLPELRLRCELEPPEQALEILPQLNDPETSRAMLEQSISAGGAAYRGMHIAACQPEILNYKPGSRCTIRYHLTYPDGDAGSGWPATVIAKTYRGHKGEQAYNGMAALWNSPLSQSATVHIAEPLAYVPAWKLLVQAPLAEDQTLEHLLQATLRAGDPAMRARLEGFVRAAAAGLAELHLSGARAEETVTWEERSTTIPEALERIAAVAPDLAAAFQPLFDHLAALAAAHAPDLPAPSHGSFDSDQVLIAQDQISFIDFDSFCMAEPAMDVGHFRAAIMDSGMKLIDETTLQSATACAAYLDQFSALGDIFLTEYERLAPISRQRLAIWEAWDYLRDALHVWTKPKREGAEAVVRILEYHLRGMGILTT